MNVSPSKCKFMWTIADANCENNFIIGGDDYYDGDNDYIMMALMTMVMMME